MASTPCPFCGSRETTVDETRGRNSDAEVMRRRQCLKCHRRHVTIERVEIPPPNWQMARKGGVYPEEETLWQRQRREGKR